MMSGLTVGRALRDRFDAIRRAELERLQGKLAGLTAADRQFVYEITSEVINALARGPEQALAGDVSPSAVDALVRLFGLEV